MKYLLMGAAAIALLTACGKKDGGDAGIEASGSEIAQIVKPGKVKARSGDPATASEALAAFSLTAEAGQMIEIEDQSLKGDTAHFEALTLTNPSGEKFSIDKMEIAGLAMIDGAPSFSRVLMSDVTLPEDDDGSSMGTIKSIELVNPSPALAAYFAEFISTKGNVPDGTLAPEDISFDQFSLNGFNVTIDEADGESGMISLANVDVFGANSDKVDSFSMSNLVMDITDPSDDMEIKGEVKKIELGGLNLKVLSGAAGQGLSVNGPSDLLSGLSTKGHADDPANPGYELFNMEGLEFDVSGAKLKMAEMHSSVKKDKQGRVTTVSTDPFKVTLEAGEGKVGSQLAVGLASLGYEKVELSGEQLQKYDPETDIMTLVEGKNYYKLADGFRLDMSGKFEGMKAMVAITEQAGDEKAAEAALLESLDAIVLHDFTLALDDNGIVDRAFNAYAAQSGQDPADVRAQVSGLMAMAPMMAGGSGIDPALVNEVTSVLSSFISDPKTLTLSFEPASPLAASMFTELDDPSAITKDMLGFSASNE